MGITFSVGQDVAARVALLLGSFSGKLSVTARLGSAPDSRALTCSTLSRCALWHRASPELYDETDDAEYGRDPSTQGEQGRPIDCSTPVIGMGAARGVDPERGKQNDGKRHKGHGRPKKRVNGTVL
jgi:hypothetical protein